MVPPIQVRLKHLKHFCCRFIPRLRSRGYRFCHINLDYFRLSLYNLGIYGCLLVIFKALGVIISDHSQHPRHNVCSVRHGSGSRLILPPETEAEMRGGGKCRPRLVLQCNARSRGVAHVFRSSAEPGLVSVAAERIRRGDEVGSAHQVVAEAARRVVDRRLQTSNGFTCGGASSKTLRKPAMTRQSSPANRWSTRDEPNSPAPSRTSLHCTSFGGPRHVSEKNTTAEVDVSPIFVKASVVFVVADVAALPGQAPAVVVQPSGPIRPCAPR